MTEKFVMHPTAVFTSLASLKLFKAIFTIWLKTVGNFSTNLSLNYSSKANTPKIAKSSLYTFEAIILLLFKIGLSLFSIKNDPGFSKKSDNTCFLKSLKPAIFLMIPIQFAYKAIFYKFYTIWFEDMCIVKYRKISINYTSC